MIELNKIYNEDCLIGMERMINQSMKVDLISNPPYKITANRNFIGFELSKEYCDIANKKIGGIKWS